MANFSLQYIVSKKAEAIQFPFCSPTTFLCSEEERKNQGFFFSAGRDNIYASKLLFDSLPSCRKCSSMQVQEMCLCLVISGMRSRRVKGWETLVDGCAIDDLPALTAWPLMVERDHGCLRSTEGLQNAGSAKAGRMPHTRISWCLLESLRALQLTHSAVCRIGLLLLERKKPHLRRISVCAKGLLKNR